MCSCDIAGRRVRARDRRDGAPCSQITDDAFRDLARDRDRAVERRLGRIDRQRRGVAGRHEVARQAQRRLRGLSPRRRRDGGGAGGGDDAARRAARRRHAACRATRSARASRCAHRRRRYASHPLTQRAAALLPFAHRAAHAQVVATGLLRPEPCHLARRRERRRTLRACRSPRRPRTSRRSRRGVAGVNQSRASSSSLRASAR